MQALPELSVACDTGDHLGQLRVLASVERTAWSWLHYSIPAGPTRPLTVSCSFSLRPVTWRMPQGSLLQPLLFNIYAKPSGILMKYLGSNASHYIDDIQLYVSFTPLCWQHSPKPCSVESKVSIAGRGWSQKISEWGWLEEGSITNYALTLLMWTILQTQSPKRPSSASPVSIIFFSSCRLAMLMCVSPIWTGLLWLSTSC